MKVFCMTYPFASFSYIQSKLIESFFFNLGRAATLIPKISPFGIKFANVAP